MIRIGSVAAATYMDAEWIIINTHIEFVDLAFRDEPRVLNRPGLKAFADDADKTFGFG